MRVYRALFIGVSLFIYRQVHSFDGEFERKKIESSIKSELSWELSRVIQEGQYLLFVSVQGEEKNVIPEKVSNFPVQQKKESVPEQSFLPGFVAIPQENSMDSSGTNREDFLPVERNTEQRRYQVTNIAVDVLHPFGVEQETVGSLNRLITDRLQRLYPGALVQVRFERMAATKQQPLPQQPQERVNRQDPDTNRVVLKESPADELASFLVRNFLPIVMLLLLGLGLFLLSIILLFLMWSRSNNTERKGEKKVVVKNIRSWDSHPPVQNWRAPSSKEDTLRDERPILTKRSQKWDEPVEKTEEELQELRSEADRAEEDFSKMFSQEPLISRRYVQELLSTDKDLLLSSLNSSVFRGAVATLMGVSKQEGTEWKNLLKNLSIEDQVQKRLEIFKRQIKDLRAYQDLMRTQIGEGSLGKLSFLSSDELERVLSDLDAGDVVQVLRHIRPELLRDFMKSMSESRRKDLLTRGLEEQKTISDERKDILTKKISNRVDDVETTIFTSKASQDQIFGYLLETSQDRRTLLDNIRRKDESLFRKYEHYGIGLEDFFRERDTGLINIVLESLENEDLVVICLNLPSKEREKIFSMLPPQRKSLIQNMVYASGAAGTDTKAFEDAKGKLINSYRARRKMSV